jgi:hypothetical protein
MMSQAYSKNHRLTLVLDTVSKMGSGMPADICVRIAQRMGVDGKDPAFVRAIYRDLKQLADEGRLTADFFSPSGERLEPAAAETAKNVRVEYKLAADQAVAIPGWKTLHDFGGRLIPSSRQMGWKISFASESTAGKHFSFLFQVHGGQWAVLQLPANEFPAKIVFCRESELEPLPANYGKTVSDRQGVRTLVFACPDPSVSRGSLDRVGHAVLTIDHAGGLTLQDLGSKTGTHFAPCSDTFLEESLSAKTSQATVPLGLNPFEKEASWEKAGNGPTAIPVAAMIRFGAYRAAVLVKK